MAPSAPQMIHPVPASEIPGWTRTLMSTFLENPTGERAQRAIEMVRRAWEPERAWGIRDRGRWVATLATEARNLTVPTPDGTSPAATARLPADALTAVTVAATHRRRGLLTQMLDASLAAARERGDAVSMLIAAQWPIYGRFGYAPATLIVDHVLHTEFPGSQVRGDVARVRHVDLDEFLALAPGIYEAARRRRAGGVDRDPPWWARHFGRDGFPVFDENRPHNYLVHEGDDGDDGLLTWSANPGEHDPPPRSIVTVQALHAVDDAAHRDLWAYVSGLDNVDEVRVRTPLDEPVRWLLPDARSLRSARVQDGLWLRLLDVPRALAARRYAVAGELVLEVLDDTPVSVAGRYRLHDDGVRAVCEPTRSPPQITLTQPALASAYLGGFPVSARRIAGEVTEHVPGALRRADAMFATVPAPFNATEF